MTPSANIVFALTLFAAVTALALWLARRHQRTIYRRNMTQRVASTLAHPAAESAESLPAGEDEPAVKARMAS